MSGMNFFHWIRDGVRQSVLLGVGDAMQQLGTSPANEELHPELLGFLQGNRSANAAPKIANASSTAAPKGRKRLGKSLKDIGNDTADH